MTAETVEDQLETDIRVLHEPEWFCRRVGVSIDYVRTHMDDLEHHKIGRYTRFCEDCVTAFLEQTKVEPRTFARSSRSQRSDRRRRN